MKTDKTAFFLTLPLNLALCLCFLCASVYAQTKSSGAQSIPGSPSDRLKGQLAKAKVDVIQAAIDYKSSLEKLLVDQEGDVKTAADMLEKRKALLAQNIISKKDVEDSERMLAAAQAKMNETRKQMGESDDLIKDAQAAEALSEMPQVKPKPRINSQKKTTLKKNQPAKRAKTCKGCMVI